MVLSRMATCATLLLISPACAQDSANDTAGGASGDHGDAGDDGNGDAGDDGDDDGSDGDGGTTGGDAGGGDGNTDDGGGSTTGTGDGTTGGGACSYPSGAVEPMALGEVLSPYSWGTAIDGSGAMAPLDLEHAPCDDDPTIEWSPHDVLVFVSIPAW